MRAEQFQEVLASVPRLSETQLDELLKAVDERRARTKALRVIETAKGPVKCPRCTFDRVVKNGHARGLQRYRCVGCSKTFNATTGTPLAGLHHKERFFQQGDCLAKGLTVREAAEVMGVSLGTAFRLRHRFLKAVVAHQATAVTGLVEADETYFRESQKGSRKLARVSRKRGGKAADAEKAKDLVPVLVAKVRGSQAVADKTLTAMTADQAEEALKPEHFIVSGLGLQIINR